MSLELTKLKLGKCPDVFCKFVRDDATKRLISLSIDYA